MIWLGAYLVGAFAMAALLVWALLGLGRPDGFGWISAALMVVFWPLLPPVLVFQFWKGNRHEHRNL